MAYNIDKNLKAGIELLEKGEKTEQALKLINKSARKGTTKGKSFFEVGKIIREGISGLEPSVAESRKYFDQAMVHFLKEQPNDSLDYREMGDYYFYGLGTEAVNRDKAIEYYNLANDLGDEDAINRLTKVKDEIDNGSLETSPELSKEVKLEETPVNETVEEHHEEVSASTNDEVKEEVKTEEKKVEEHHEEVKEETVEKSPVVINTSKEDELAAKKVNDMDEGDQLLIKAIRLLDSPASTEADKRKGIEYAKAASDAGVMRASILMGYLYEGNNELLKQDLLESKRYYEIAISRGSASAEYRLGLLYLNSDASFADDEKGHQLILSSARRGYPYALNYIADCFRVKVSDPRYLDLAYRYYSLAGERGLGLAYHNMAEIDASRQEIQLAQLHEKYALDNGFDSESGTQVPLFTTIRI